MSVILPLHREKSQPGKRKNFTGVYRSALYINGNPKNVSYGVATYQLGVSEATTFDIISPKDRPTNNAIVDHTMGAAMRGAITVLMNKPDANPGLGKGDKILLR